MPVNATISAVTEAIIARSAAPRRRYLDRIDAAVARQPKRKALGCANLAHGFAACGAADKNALRNGDRSQSRHRHRLQRHAVGASALRDLSRR